MNVQRCNIPFTSAGRSNLKFRRADFYVNIKGYGKNQGWADKIIKTADSSVDLIKNNVCFENILHLISKGVAKANQLTDDLGKYMHSGIMRGKRAGWEKASDDWSNFELQTPYGKHGLSKYAGYEAKLDYIAQHPLKNPYPDIELTKPIITKNKKYLRHGDDSCVNNALNLIARIYGDFSKYLNKNISEKDLININNYIAEIRWILAHSTPWERGSDSISNVLMRAMYKSLGIKTFPLSKGVSLDMEAFCTNLSEYKRKFPLFFEQPPKLVKNA